VCFEVPRSVFRTIEPLAIHVGEMGAKKREWKISIRSPRRQTFHKSSQLLRRFARPFNEELRLTNRIHRLFLFTVLAVCGLALAACESERHTMVETKPGGGTRVVCQECYDEVAKVRRRAGYRGHGPAYTQNVSVHQCSQCRTEMAIYSENDVLMVKCARCAPEGLPCDKCLPPRGPDR
jgi:hypothetical protein